MFSSIWAGTKADSERRASKALEIDFPTSSPINGMGAPMISWSNRSSLYGEGVHPPAHVMAGSHNNGVCNPTARGGTPHSRDDAPFRRSRTDARITLDCRIAATASESEEAL